MKTDINFMRNTIFNAIKAKKVNICNVHVEKSNDMQKKCNTFQSNIEDNRINQNNYNIVATDADNDAICESVTYISERMRYIFEAGKIIDPPANTHASYDYLEDFGFTDNEIEQYFEKKSYMMHCTPNYGLNYTKVSIAYFIKDGIEINGKQINSIKELMQVLGKNSYFDNIINQLVENFSNGNKQLKENLSNIANEFLKNYEGDLALFSVELGKELKNYVEKLNNYQQDYSSYKFESPQKFIEDYEKGNMPFEIALEILKKAGATVTKDFQGWSGNLMSVDIIELIHFEYNNVSYSVFRTVEPTEVKDAIDISKELQDIAQNFEIGNLTVAQAIEELEKIGITDIVKVMYSRFKETGDINSFVRQIGFTYNGINYKITSTIPETKFGTIAK